MSLCSHNVLQITQDKPGSQSKSLSFGNVIFMQNNWTIWSVGAGSTPARWTLSDVWLPCSVRCARLPGTRTTSQSLL